MDNAKLTVSTPVRSWHEKNGVITFRVTSNGRTGEEWITYFESRGIIVLARWGKDVLRSTGFKPTNGVTTEIAVLKDELFTDADLTTSFIRAEADKRGLTKPNAEAACLIRELFTDAEIKAMGLNWIVAMHGPTEDSDRSPLLLGAGRAVDGSWLSALYGGPVGGWPRGYGFAFAASRK